VGPRPQQPALSDRKLRSGDIRCGDWRPHARRATGQLSPGVPRVAHTSGGGASFLMMIALWQDVRYAIRTFRRAPAFTALAILTIAIGVGANAAIFSVVNAALLRPLPYPRDGELVLVTGANRITKQSVGDATPANFLDWRERNRSFTGMAGFRQANFAWTSG